jgi:molecular chaperone DnaK
MSVVQFVHEPLAALYGFLRMSEGTSDLIRRYDGKLLLVFDWGGGTLDLTLVPGAQRSAGAGGQRRHGGGRW